MDDRRETDLFGNPVRARKGQRGRPPKELSSKDLDMLEAGLVQGWTNKRIASALDIGLSTLKRNFGPLLRVRDHAPDRLQLALFATTARKALEGDMGAVRQLRQLLAESEQKAAAARMSRAGEDAEEKDEPVGKKERARRAAEEVAESGGGDLWGGDLNPNSYH